MSADNDLRDNFAAEYSVLNKLWEALSPDPVLGAVRDRLSLAGAGLRVGAALQRHGKLIWHRLGAKTIELIHENVHVDAVRDDLDTLVLDADLLEAVLSNPDPKKAKEIESSSRAACGSTGQSEVQGAGRAPGGPEDRHQQGLLLNSVDFLKELLALAKDVVKTERETPEEEEDRGKAALTELFKEARNGDTPIMVERVVDDIDEIVRRSGSTAGRHTHAGEREVKKALRQTLFKYKLHQDESCSRRRIATSGSITDSGIPGARPCTGTAVPGSLFHAKVFNHDGGPVGELRHQFQLATHALHVMAQGGQQHVAAPFEARDGVLAHAKLRGQVFLCLLRCSPEILERCQLHGALLDSDPTFRRQRSDHVIEFSCHVSSPWFLLP
jgi:hypothetical protein